MDCILFMLIDGVQQFRNHNSRVLTHQWLSPTNKFAALTRFWFVVAMEAMTGVLCCPRCAELGCGSTCADHHCRSSVAGGWGLKKRQYWIMVCSFTNGIR
ncbi:hypothetical protein HanHA300_Chr13g0476201 [Helianthus annuus]|nr:hypothetical protein HanHA300_Chr13g0476201 [Helianthus annuus]KAJ0497146.1 hypothetical protein HanHA89_Chr13g0508171 [Helianthus annuus]